jgi:hypothetical protein
MALCTKCIIGGVVQGGSSFDFDEESDAAGFHLEFAFELDTDFESSKGKRAVAFDGELADGTLVDGELRGYLSGRFDVLSEKELRAPATIRTFSSRGVLSFLVVEAEDETGRVFFTANVRPREKFLDPRLAIRGALGSVFLGWNDPARAELEGLA